MLYFYCLGRTNGQLIQMVYSNIDYKHNWSGDASSAERHSSFPVSRVQSLRFREYTGWNRIEKAEANWIRNGIIKMFNHLIDVLNFRK